MVNEKSKTPKSGKSTGLTMNRPGAAARAPRPSEDDWVKIHTAAVVPQPLPPAQSDAALAPAVASPIQAPIAEPMQSPAKPRPKSEPAARKAQPRAEQVASDDLPRFTLAVEKEMFQKFSIFCVRAGVTKMHFFRDYLLRVRDDQKLATRIIAQAAANPHPTPKSVKRISIDLSTDDKEYVQTQCIRADVTMADFWRTVIAEAASSVKD